jgi:histidyl-tRNA synthetase
VKEKLLKNVIETYYIPIIDTKFEREVNALTTKLRNEGKQVISGFEIQNISKALEFANKKKISKVILLGSNEYKKKEYLIKDMITGEQKFEKLEL